ncbi:B3 domain-containing protein os01g0234100 [Phtheirospermum japonicum]|uniref:B3 domain-containing protein os01g0234100 n=1 Tax=Phtheirospermum japonicum TaxID=374723 RepID=A0A830CWL4_9LAMI|nr:B3 domain-containing protein os01g0234100 [Phtheirospermum japonicum]
MKLRIVRQNQENRAGDEQLTKHETREMAEQMEDHQICVSTEDEFVKDGSNSPPLNPIPISTYEPLLLSGTLNSGGTSMSKGDVAQLKSPTMIRAEQVQSSLDNDQPSFLKFLVRSHVASCFWMGLPVPFCKLHLPFTETTVIVENEAGDEFPVKYIANKTGLSAGWRKFVAGNQLLEGDVLIFQLTKPCRLKVYVIRANDLPEVDGALSLLILDSQTKQSDAEGTMDAQHKKKGRPKSLPLTVVQRKKQKEGPSSGNPPGEPSGNDSDEVASEVLEGSESALRFKDVKSFEEFHVTVNGACIDSEIPEHICRKYYDLCRVKNSFLHSFILPGLYTKLVAGMIVETVNIADAIRGCKLTTQRDELEVWEKSLRSFELLGLNVGFLRARLKRIVSMVFESEDALDMRRYWDARMDFDRNEDEIRCLETKIVGLKELSAKCDQDVEDLKMKAEKYEVMFQEEVDASW